MLGQWLTAAPRWVLCLVMGGLFGALFIPLTFVLDPGRQGAESVLGGVVVSLAFGAVMGTIAHGANRRFSEVVGSMSMSERRAVNRVVGREIVPADSVERDRVHRIAAFRLEESRRQRPLLLIGHPLLAVVFVLGALVDSPLYWIAVVGVAALSALWVRQYRQLQRRVAVLRPSAEE